MLIELTKHGETNPQSYRPAFVLECCSVYLRTLQIGAGGLAPGNIGQDVVQLRESLVKQKDGQR